MHQIKAPHQNTHIYSQDQNTPINKEPTLEFGIPKPDFTIDDLFQELFDQQLERACSALFQRAYWRRMWIVQEVLLAEKLLILCGDQVCDRSAIVSIVSEFQFLGQILGQNSLPIDKSPRNQTPVLQLKQLQGQVLSSRAYAILTEGTDSNRLQQRGAGWELSELIQRWHQQECADPRDRVYGLLGLARGEIRADYDKTLEDIFGNVVVSQSLELTDQEYACFVTTLTKALYLDPSPEKIEELGLISGIDLETELSVFRDFLVLPPWPLEQDHTAEDNVLLLRAA